MKHTSYTTQQWPITGRLVWTCECGASSAIQFEPALTFSPVPVHERIEADWQVHKATWQDGMERVLTSRLQDAMADYLAAVPTTRTCFADIAQDAYTKAGQAG